MKRDTRVKDEKIETCNDFDIFSFGKYYTYGYDGVGHYFWLFLNFPMPNCRFSVFSTDKINVYFKDMTTYLLTTKNTQYPVN